jgi:hypothetical protein
MGILKMEFFGTPAIGKVRCDQFADFHRGVGDEGNAVVVKFDVFMVCGGVGHGTCPVFF